MQEDLKELYDWLDLAQSIGTLEHGGVASAIRTKMRKMREKYPDLF